MLRQHELCWRRPATSGELRIALYGSSAVYGFPLPVEETFGDYLNQHFAAAGIPARLFNLAFVTPYQVRDAVIIHESLAYAPDVIIYPLTLAEFRHLAPMPFPTSTRFFNMNDRALRETIAARPPGLEEPFGNLATWLSQSEDQRQATDQLRDTGLYARALARAGAHALAATFNSPRPRFKPKPSGRQAIYDCAKTRRDTASAFRDWKGWNILAYLEALQQRGIPVLVVHWPIAHEPLEDCYSIRYTNADVADFAAWIERETQHRHLAYLDLRQLLPEDLFIDSLHCSAEGHRLIAERVAQALDPLFRTRAKQPMRTAEQP